MFVRMCLNCRTIPMPICHLSLSKLSSTRTCKVQKVAEQSLVFYLILFFEHFQYIKIFELKRLPVDVCHCKSRLYRRSEGMNRPSLFFFKRRVKCWLKALELTRGEIRPVKSHRGLDSCASNESLGNVFVWVDATTKYDATAVYPGSCGRGLNIYK